MNYIFILYFLMFVVHAHHHHNDGVNPADEVKMTPQQIAKGKAMRFELKTPKAGTNLTILIFFVPIVVGILAIAIIKLKKE